MSQNPSGGRLREGSIVEVVVSLGPQPVNVPALAGQPATAAAQVLRDLGLAVGGRTYETSMTVAAGVVVASSPDHGTLLPGQAVDLDISKGKPLVAVPAVATGTTFAQYQAALSAVGLVAFETQSYDDYVAKGLVIGATPARGVAGDGGNGCDSGGVRRAPSGGCPRRRESLGRSCDSGALRERVPGH